MQGDKILINHHDKHLDMLAGIILNRGVNQCLSISFSI